MAGGSIQGMADSLKFNRQQKTKLKPLKERSKDIVKRTDEKRTIKEHIRDPERYASYLKRKKIRKRNKWIVLAISILFIPLLIIFILLYTSM